MLDSHTRFVSPVALPSPNGTAVCLHMATLQHPLDRTKTQKAAQKINRSLISPTIMMTIATTTTIHGHSTATILSHRWHDRGNVPSVRTRLLVFFVSARTSTDRGPSHAYYVCLRCVVIHRGRRIDIPRFMLRNVLGSTAT